MNNKDDIRDQFSPLLDGELSPEERASVEAALSDDAELLRELDSMKRVDDLFRAMPAMTAPDDFEAVVRDRIAPRRVAAVAAAAAAPPQRQIARRRFAPMLAAAAALIVCAGAIVFVIGIGANREQLASAPAAELRSISPAASSPAPQEPIPTAAADTAGPHNETLANSAMEQAKIVAAGEAASAPAEPSHEALEGVAGKDEPAQVADASATAGQSAPIQLQRGMPADESERDQRARAKKSEDSVALGAVSAMAKPSAPPDEPVPSEMKTEYLSASPPAAAAGSALSEEVNSPSRMPEITAATPAPPPQAPPASIEPGAIDRMPAGKPKLAEPKGGASAKTKRDTAKESAPSTIQRSIAARSFTLRGGVWYERGYDDDATVALLRDSDAFRALVKEYANVEMLLELKEAVVFKAGERWYKMPPEKSPN